MEQIKNRFTGEIMCGGLSLKIILEKHKKCIKGEEGGARASLSYANLSGADLYCADLTGANLYYANLSYASLSYANLSGADLSGADLTDANLYCADLSGADLYCADLFGANLFGANLSRANLARANLARADLSGADLRRFKSDVWFVLHHAPNEIDNLINKIKAGEIDGSQYEGECRCLCGTLEGNGTALPIRDPLSPAEQWFSMIKKGDTPENCKAAKIALKWIEEYKKLQEINK